MPPPHASARPPPRSAPSGIAQQLRKSSEQHAQVPQPQAQPDTMNLDDFIFPSSVGSPAGLSPEASNDTPGPFHATAPAIPIRKPNQASDCDISLARASAPSVPPLINRENEFAYVPRHVRKTSIDERRVSVLSCAHLALCSPTNALSATQAPRRGLSPSPARQQHYDTDRRPSRSRSEPVLARPLHAPAALPGLAGPGPLLH
jgi:GATA-binding protein